VATPVVFTTDRAERHQNDALKMAPDRLDVTMLRNPDRKTLVAALARARCLVSERRGAVDASLMDAAPDLSLILRLGSLAHDIDLVAARERNIVVCRRGQEGAIRVAEHVVMQALALLRRLSETLAIGQEASDDWAPRRETDENSFAYNWSKRENLLGLHDRTIGILGFGEIGAELTRRLNGWRCHLVYHRRSRLPEAVERDLRLCYVDGETLLAESDVLVCLLPYTPETRLSVGRDAIATMKQGAVLVSAGSGGVIDEEALAQAIVAGRLAGAALDTFAVEPVEAGNPLVVAAREGANILLTPHVAGGSPPDAWDELRRMYDPVIDHLEGREAQERLA